MTQTVTNPNAMATPGAGVPMAARWVLQLLEKLQGGRLQLRTPSGELLEFGHAEPGGLNAHLHLHDWAVCSAALRGGDIGFAQAYIEGRWSSTDLTTLLQLLSANRKAIEALVYGKPWRLFLSRIRHWMQRNTKSGSRRNIHAHYDIGNAFYALWLDPSFNYSSAWFDGRFDQTLEQAQWAKVRRALAQCQLQPGGRVLEVGCGWGAVAEVAARDVGAKLTGVTLSNEQLVFANQRLQRQGLQADLRLQDYRDIADAPFDAVVSIEMFEAVGRAFWPEYFATVKRLLKPGGRACIQSIVIKDELFERYAQSTDFIQQYIFPGGMLPSPQQFRAAAAGAGLKVVDEIAFGADYAETLKRWRERFKAEEAAVRGQGFDDRFLRTWEFYLSYCEAAFLTADTNVMQFTLVN